MSAKTGFQKITIHGGVIFAANGPNIHSFSVEGHKHLTSWKYPHPWLALKDTAVKEATPAEVVAVESAAQASTESPVVEEGESEAVEDGPPSKRRKVESEPKQEAVNGKESTEVVAGGEDVEDVDGEDKVMADTAVEPEAAKDDKSKAQNGKKRGNGKNYGLGFGKQKEILDIPMFQCMAITTDGKYLVGAIGTTKTIWTFEHDGKGGLTELSQRPMPKRPCSIIITSDNKTILSADKFGDVYALPVIPSSETTPSLSRSATPSTTQPYKYQANPLTVHTKRNLQALEHQKKQAEKGQTDKPTAPAQDFEHKLVLGHVSMLTDINLASFEGKEYIITADRDEHIRISRGLPQSHVIENYCLGHKEFVSALHVPQTHPHILISGGGDPELYVWDWTRGELLQKIPLGLGEEHPTLPLAVSGIASSSADGGDTQVVVVCENSSVAYRYTLTQDHTLTPSGHQSLDGNAFDVVSYSSKFIVSTDPNSATDSEPASKHFLHVFGVDAPSPAPVFDECVVLVDDVPEGRLDDLHKALYTIEPLRKVGYERKDGAGEDEDEEGGEAGEGQEAPEQDQAAG